MTVLAMGIAAYFILNRNTEPIRPHVSATVDAFRSTLTATKSELPGQDPKNPPAPIATPAEPALEEHCWEKLSAQVKEDEFALQNRNVFREIVGDWYFFRDTPEVPEEETSPSGMFLRALLEAGLLDGHLLPGNHDARALELLAKVHEADPDNSAPLIYAAVIENRRGHEVEAQRLFLRAQQTNRFDSYITTVTRTIFSQVKNPSDLVQAHALWSKLPVPKYYELSKYLRDPNSRFFTEQMTRSALNKKNILPDIDWFVLEYATGLSVENKLNPGNKLPTYREMMEQKKKLNPFEDERMLAALKKNCDLSSLNDYVAEFQKYMENSK